MDERQKQLKQAKDAVKMAKKEIKEWQKFLKVAEKRVLKFSKDYRFA